MTSNEKMTEILGFVKNVTGDDWGFMMCLKQDLEHLIVIAQTEGVREARDALNKVWNKE